MGIAYNTSIVRSGLVLHLDAANPKSYPGSGTIWKDLSGRGNNGTLINGVGYSASNNGSLVFDGVNDYSTVASSSSMNTMTAVTACMWIKFPSIPITGIPFNKEGSLRLFVAEVNTTKFTIRLGSSWGSVPTGATSLQANVWYYSCMTFDGTTVNLYLNNVLDFTGNQPGVFANSNVLHIGAFSSASYFSNSSISSVQLYNRALSASEINQNFEALRGRYGI
jgi:hypothetical protein